MNATYLKRLMVATCIESNQVLGIKTADDSRVILIASREKRAAHASLCKPVNP